MVSLPYFPVFCILGCFLSAGEDVSDVFMGLAMINTKYLYF